MSRQFPPAGMENISVAPPEWRVPGTPIIVREVSPSRFALRRPNGSWLVRKTGAPLTFRGIAAAGHAAIEMKETP